MRFGWQKEKKVGHKQSVRWLEGERMAKAVRKVFLSGKKKARHKQLVRCGWQ